MKLFKITHTTFKSVRKVSWAEVGSADIFISASTEKAARNKAEKSFPHKYPCRIQSVEPFKVKSIDLIAMEWFDKTYGNSYFSCLIILNRDSEQRHDIALPLQYGYGDHYTEMAGQKLMKLGILPLKKHTHGGQESLWSYCQDRKIPYRTTKHENCLKRDVVAHGSL